MIPMKINTPFRLCHPVFFVTLILLHLDVSVSTTMPTATPMCYVTQYYGYRGSGICSVMVLRNDSGIGVHLDDAFKFCNDHSSTFTTQNTSYYHSQNENNNPGVKTYTADNFDLCAERKARGENCSLFCVVPSCPYGKFSPPDCQEDCHCSDQDACDILSGACRDNNACGDFHFGMPYCQKECHCNIQPQCDHNNGSCTYGCGAGWTGPDCQTPECPLYTHSPPACDQPCRCKDNVTCNSFSGECPPEVGCAPGWKGIGCAIENTTENDCDIGDPHCKSVGREAKAKDCYCEDPTCILPPEQCLQKDGQPCQGPDCAHTSPCPVGRYGPPHCVNKCGCLELGHCNPIDGNCSGTECQPGMVGDFCDIQGCPQSYYPHPKCDHFCACDDGAQCDSKTGFCPNKRCEPGFSGSSCSKRSCPLETFNPPDCDGKCHCQLSEACSPIDGRCLAGECQDAWSGPFCQGSIVSPAKYLFGAVRFWHLALGVLVCSIVPALAVWTYVIHLKRGRASIGSRMRTPLTYSISISEDEPEPSTSANPYPSAREATTDSGLSDFEASEQPAKMETTIY